MITELGLANRVYSSHKKDQLIELIFNDLQDKLLKDPKKKSIISKKLKSLLHTDDYSFIEAIKKDFRVEIIIYTSQLQYNLERNEKDLKKTRRNLISCIQNQWNHVPINARPLNWKTGQPQKIRKLPNSTLRDLSGRIVNLYHIRQNHFLPPS